MRAFLFFISLLASRVSWSTKDVENGGKEGPASPGNDQLEDHFRLKDVVLDLANTNELVLSKVDDPFGGVGFYSWLPNEGHRLTEVMDGSFSIWKGNQNEHAKKVTLYYSKSGLSLLSLNILSGSISSVLHYDGSRGRVNDDPLTRTTHSGHNDHSVEHHGSHSGHPATHPFWEVVEKEEFNKMLEAWQKESSGVVGSVDTTVHIHPFISKTNESVGAHNDHQNEHNDRPSLLTVDLAVKPDLSHFFFATNEVDGAHVVTYRPLNGLYVGTIEDSGMPDGPATIWRSTGGEVCTLIKSHNKYGATTLTLHTLQNGVSGQKEFVKRYDEWRVEVETGGSVDNGSVDTPDGGMTSDSGAHEESLGASMEPLDSTDSSASLESPDDHSLTHSGVLTTLDIARPANLSDFFFKTKGTDGVFTEYTVLSDKILHSIVESGAPIWTRGDENCRSVYLHEKIISVANGSVDTQNGHYGPTQGRMDVPLDAHSSHHSLKSKILELVFEDGKPRKYFKRDGNRWEPVEGSDVANLLVVP